MVESGPKELRKQKRFYMWKINIYLAQAKCTSQSHKFRAYILLRQQHICVGHKYLGLYLTAIRKSMECEYKTVFPAPIMNLSTMLPYTIYCRILKHNLFFSKMWCITFMCSMTFEWPRDKNVPNIQATLLSSLNDTLKYGVHVITMICNNLYELYWLIMFYWVPHRHLTHLLVENVSNSVTGDKP